jgi:hypothetical protein
MNERKLRGEFTHLTVDVHDSSVDDSWMVSRGPFRCVRRRSTERRFCTSSAACGRRFRQGSARGRLTELSERRTAAQVFVS